MPCNKHPSPTKTEQIFILTFLSDKIQANVVNIICGFFQYNNYVSCYKYNKNILIDKQTKVVYIYLKTLDEDYTIYLRNLLKIPSKF